MGTSILQSCLWWCIVWNNWLSVPFIKYSVIIGVNNVIPMFKGLPQEEKVVWLSLLHCLSAFYLSTGAYATPFQFYQGSTVCSSALRKAIIGSRSVFECESLSLVLDLCSYFESGNSFSPEDVALFKRKEKANMSFIVPGKFLGSKSEKSKVFH